MRGICIGLAVILLCTGSICVFAEPSTQVDTEVSTQLVEAESGILMEASTGEVLYEWEPDKRLQIASVTKVMTMLLIMEALDSGKIHKDDMVTVSENAASMGGSQVFLEVGEQMSVNDMLKAIAVASGNDAAVAMAEYIGGTHEAFVEKMNKKAQELQCENTHFINCNGLDETQEHYSSARDIAKISRELIKHQGIFDYTTIWMDSLRDGKFGLSNTNRLIRFYPGANGLKTGSTSAAKYCLSATAERDGMQLIAVVLGAPSTAERFDSASSLLDYGFANYAVADGDTVDMTLPSLPVQGGTVSVIPLEIKDGAFIVKKGNQDKVEKEISLEPSVKAPVAAGDKLGEIIFKIDGEEAARRDIVAAAGVDRIGTLQMFQKILKQWAAM
ncbi:D-alanyl-D-alanine carboxypeptidase [Oscillospiraceae bacterium DSM 107454]|uniref:serine-type D-Ala-D-Ala carboxypeptidase n=2 Tax=Ructibacterium gallinarum TaxID=2779355 RepID=A0A9D5M0T4_9FIRM|nr:D-alanyl-D-alanine carboxypeptidase [Ructibacterium gallinarum]